MITLSSFWQGESECQVVTQAGFRGDEKLNNTYKVIFSGTLKAGTDVEQFISGFMQLFKVPEEQARKLASMGRAITLKENLDAAAAEKYRQVLDKLGMQVHVEPISAAPLSINPISAPPASTPADDSQQDEVADTRPRCPKCGSDRLKDDDCLACGIIISRFLERQARSVAESAATTANPYATPQSDLTLVSSGEPGTMNGPHSVPAGNGWSWITAGWSYFSRNPFAWIGALIVWMLLMVVGSLIPFLGSLAINLLAPVFTAGFLLGANEQREGGNFEVSHLFAGFSHNTGGLVLVGLFYMIGMVLITVVVAMMVGGTLFAMSGTLQSANSDPQALAMTLGGPMLIAVLVAALLVIPLMMAYWFAPGLVALEGVSPIDAMKMSFSACLKNIMPFLIYSLIALLLMIVAIIPFGLGLFVLMPVMIAAMYASYRDIFYAAE